MKNKVIHIFLSPHLDDAVLSCTGMIHHLVKGNEKVKVITLFSGYPDLQDNSSAIISHIHSQCGDLKNLASIRRKEDELSVSSLGADFLHMDYNDCIYRRDEKTNDYYILSPEDIFGGLKDPDRSLPEKIAGHMRGLIPPPDGVQFYAPMGIGGHVDHQLTHMAAVLLKKSGFSMIFYEDYPYSENRKECQKTYAALSGKFKCQKHRVRFTQEEIDIKIKAIALYASQVQMLFGGMKAMQASVTKYSRRRGELFIITQ